LKLRAVIVSREFVTEMVTTGHVSGAAVCVDGLPPGARLILASLERNGDLRLLFEHESFPEVKGHTEAASITYRTL
jgi:hypothetical protein